MTGPCVAVTTNQSRKPCPEPLCLRRAILWLRIKANQIAART